MPDSQPRVDRVPARTPAPLTRTQRQARKKLGPRTRLNRKLIDDYCTAVRAGAPLGGAADFIGTDRDQIRTWHRTARDAERKRPMDRSQFERLCMEFHQAVKTAEGEAMLRLHRAIATAAGLGGERPTLRTTTRRTRPDGTEEEITVIKEIPFDWRAAAHIARYRFPDEMGVTPDQEQPPPVDTTDDIPIGDLVDRIQQIAAARRQQAIDVDSHPHPNGSG